MVLERRSNDVGHGMTSPPLDSTHGRTTSGMTCHHRLWAAHTVERRQARHAIRALGQHTQSNDVGCGIPSWTLDNTQGRTTSGVACHHSPWTAKRVERRWAWHAIIAFKLADTVERRQAWHAIITFGQHTRSNDVGRGMTSPPLESTHGRTSSGVTCHHHIWTTHTVEQCRAWHAIIALGRQKGSNDVGRGMPSSLLNKLTQSDGVGRGMPLSPLDGGNGRTTSSVA